MARARPAPKTDPVTDISAQTAQTLSPWASQAATQYNPDEDLKAIVATTVTGGFLYRNPATIFDLIDRGYVETNTEMTNEAGEMATRATDAGIARINGSTALTIQGNPVSGINAQGDEVKPPVGNTQAFEIDTDIAIVPATRGRNAAKRPEIYPFDALPLGGSFHVAANGDVKEQARKFGVTVSNANSRYKVDTGETETVIVTDYQIGADGKLAKDANNKWIRTSEHPETRPVRKPTRTFQLRVVDASDKRGSGLRVFRTL